MEETSVIIVGAGPAGLALAIALSKWNIKSTVLEKNLAVCSDPRAIAIAGDAHRIVDFLGIAAAELRRFGQPLPAIHFHGGPLARAPFATLDQRRDWLRQVHPPSTVLLQPRLERALRRLVRASAHAELRLRCAVTAVREDAGGVVVAYERADGTAAQVRGAFVVGADGKRGFVRKGYLEAMGVEQRTGLSEYQSDWIAANLRVGMPTPASHPDFPLWRLGYEPEELWDLFWPDGFHFCNHPTMPVAAGRFGPADDKYWRFEYELPDGFLPDDLEKHLEEQMQPHLTLPKERLTRNGKTADGPVRFPWDCVEILRCGPANFVHKVVNQWFHNRVILIGDAAHVFPPFGAQGIANGFRDAFSLSWRLALLCNSAVSSELSLNSDSLLTAWSRERREGVDQSSIETMRSGQLLLNKSSLFAAAANLVSGILEYVPRLRDALISRVVGGADASGICNVTGGFFLANERGGRKIAQVYIKTAGGSVHLSDQLFWKPRAVLVLLVLWPLSLQEALATQETLESAKLPPCLLSNEVLELCEDTQVPAPPSPLSITRFTTVVPDDSAKVDVPLFPGYDPAGFRRRFQPTTKYVLVRSDLIVFSEAESPEQLLRHLRQSRDMLAA